MPGLSASPEPEGGAHDKQLQVEISEEQKTVFIRNSVIMFIVLGATNAGLLIIAALFSSQENSKEFFSLALLAWTFGLRHAVDADHIAAIDNVTRKLVNQGEIPVSVGLMFGMGHSAMVVVISIITVASAATLRKMEGPLADFGRFLGTLFSASVLLILSFVNIALFFSLLNAPSSRPGVPAPPAEDGEGVLENGEGVPPPEVVGGVPQGCLTRCLSGAFRLVDRPWKMFLLGLVFSLSFDTSTEVALLVLVADKPAEGEWGAAMALVLPLLFAAGMTLIDAADGVGMAWAYAYGQQHAHSRRIYNLLITGISALVALCLGVVEVLQVLADRMGWTDGWFWESVNDLDPGAMGYAVLALFGAVILAAVVYESVSACRNNNADNLALHEGSPLIRTSSNQPRYHAKKRPEC